MPSKRTPIRRGARIKITGEMVALYRRGKELRPTRLEHIRGMCPGPINEHCPACIESMETERNLDRLLGLMPWEPSPLDVCEEDERPPAWLKAGEGYDRIVEIKKQLEAAL